MALRPIIAGGYYNAGSTPNLSGYMTKAVYDPAGINAQLAGRTVANTFSVASAASAPAMLLSGAIFSGGSGATTLPHFLIQPTGATASTTWDTGGTALGINVDFSTNYFMAMAVDGVVYNYFNAAGVNSFSQGVLKTTASTDTVELGTIATLQWSTDLKLVRKAAATLQLGTDAAGVTAQMITAANRITSDGVGADFTVAAGNGRGGLAGALNLSSWTTAASGVAGTLTTIASVVIGGFTIASGKKLTLGNAAVTGLGAGLLAALTNASIVITDQGGQDYRIPCII